MKTDCFRFHYLSLFLFLKTTVEMVALTSEAGLSVCEAVRDEVAGCDIPSMTEKQTYTLGEIMVFDAPDLETAEP